MYIKRSLQNWIPHGHTEGHISVHHIKLLSHKDGVSGGVRDRIERRRALRAHCTRREVAVTAVRSQWDRNGYRWCLHGDLTAFYSIPLCLYRASTALPRRVYGLYTDCDCSFCAPATYVAATAIIALSLRFFHQSAFSWQ